MASTWCRLTMQTEAYRTTSQPRQTVLSFQPSPWRLWLTKTSQQPTNQNQLHQISQTEAEQGTNERGTLRNCKREARTRRQRREEKNRIKPPFFPSSSSPPFYPHPLNHHHDQMMTMTIIIHLIRRSSLVTCSKLQTEQQQHSSLLL